MPTIQTTKVFMEIQRAVDAGYTTVSEQGSSRSGKTYNTTIWLCDYLMRHPGTRLSVVRKTFPSIRGSVLIDFKEVLARLGAWETGRFNKSDTIFTFENGSWIEFFSCDDEQKIRGRKRDVLYVNEANELTALEWQQLKMRTTRFTIADYNPSFSDEHWLMEVNRDPRTYHFITTYHDNPFLEQTVIDEIESLRDKNRTLWQVYGLGLQAVVEGLVFTAVDTVDTVPERARRIRFRGMDFGYENDPTAIEDVYFDGKDVYVDELCYRTHMLTTDIIQVLKDNGPLVETISESAEPRLVQEIYRAGVNIHPVQKYPGSIEAGIQKMLEYRFHVTARSVNVLKEFKNYTWMQDKEGRWLNRPISGFDHCFVGETQVETAQGVKPLLAIREGDFVETSEGLRRVTRFFDKGMRETMTVRIDFKDGGTVTLTGTPEHKIKTTKGWKELGQTQEGDVMYRYSKARSADDGSVQEAAVSGVTVQRREMRHVYDIEVDGAHEFFANGVLVHNCIDGIRYVFLMKVMGGRRRAADLTQLARLAGR